MTTDDLPTKADVIKQLGGAEIGEPLCVLDESNDMEAFAALPECYACEGTGKQVPPDFWGNGLEVRATEFQVSILPADNVNTSTWSLTVAYRGFGKWAVLNGFGCLSKAGDWDYEIQPSEREDDWLAEHRFGLAEAIELAKQHAPDIRVNGLTATEVLAKIRGGEFRG